MAIFMGLGTQKVNDWMGLAPKITVQKFTLNVDYNACDINITGGISADILEVFEPFFKDFILKKLVVDTKYTVKNTLQTEINNDLEKHGTHWQIEDPSLGNFGVDFSQTRNPVVTSDIEGNGMISLFLNGTFYNTADPSL